MIKRLIEDNLPSYIINYTNADTLAQILLMLEWHWVNGNKPLSTPYWADRLGHKELDNVIFALASEDWVVSKANATAKWGEFYINQAKIDTFISIAEQLEYKTKIRVNRYKMRSTTALKPDLVKTARGVEKTGLIREGFAKAYNLDFQLDTAMLIKYYTPIQRNLTKAMDKVIEKYPTLKEDSTNYKVISQELLDYYIAHPGEKYNLEGNISDSRGRAIPQGVKRVGNPISNKDFRACLVVPNGKIIGRDDEDALKDIYLFIAELVGSKATSWTRKTLAGRVAYSKRTLHKLDLDNEDDRKDLHENIWLERIYERLDDIFTNGQAYWDIPLEVDATMSLAQIIGLLTNDARLLDRTNVISDTFLLDAWHVEGVPRLHTKTVGTPVFYGSAQSAVALLRKKKLDYTREHIKILNKEFNSGAFSVIKGFKDFLIQHSNVATPEFTMNIHNDSFNVVVNKKKPVGAKTNAYSIWDSTKNRQVVFLNHTVETVPDYDRFRLYFPTGLVHNLDGQVANSTVLELIVSFLEWVIPIHDAFLILPGSAVRKIYISKLQDIRENRQSILSSYRKSIGATGKSADIAWAKLMDKVEPLCTAIPLSESALK